MKKNFIEDDFMITVDDLGEVLLNLVSNFLVVICMTTWHASSLGNLSARVFETQSVTGNDYFHF